jgi:hypothetical protein
MPRIKFADVRFPDPNAPSVFDIEHRLKQHLINFREKMGKCKPDNQISDRDRRNILRKIAAYRDAVSRRSGMGHLADKDRQRLEMFRDGATLVHVESEHRADEIATAIHSEMPWMAEATERIWQDMRASVRNGDAAPRLKPLLLVGPPGIGKTYWARALAQHLMVPTSAIEATGEPASFSVTGSQRGWGSAGPGKPLESIMASGVANPVAVVDEIEKAGTVESTRGQRFNLSEGLLPLLERSTAKQWSCPYYRISFDMSWTTWIMTANSVDGLPAPFLSRCPPLTIPPLSMEHLLGFSDHLGAKRNLPLAAVDAVKEVIEAIKAPQLVSLRSVARMLDSVEQAINRPLLH